jgi:hypothetical protein
MPLLLLWQEREERGGVDAEPDDEGAEEGDGDFRQRANFDLGGIGICRLLPIHSADHFEIIIKAGGDGDDAKDDEDPVLLLHGAFEDE